MLIDGRSVEEKAVLQVAELMAAAARTAPKAHGYDNLEVLILTGEEKAALAAEMRRICEEIGAPFFGRDADNVDAAAAVVLMGAKNAPIGLGECRYCGFENCGATVKAQGHCAFNNVDLGIAMGSAVSVASAHKIDSRIFYTAGKAALQLNYFPPKVKVAFGIPLSVSAKSPFHDRQPLAPFTGK